ncbi:poly-beta-1,6-N-acetyl-D-glucosamine N-deacetylase PgaB [Burkholderiaceae bacterium FT117]|uniref:poly-beta-1,6-N-acetyl-D-glucosamine N-deacetylase PgaB n=1 Tax=Zeimonas sediminis TaxID=2944268 RepID=UPI002342D38A|nr:poly-beta-1,6-N-acetyl-D-glucosamine N-deacetylase PgaB [Zeimonas sediminis]MCM5571525.1 poly-beta-1,6-N-acetyl-D-glucosamine N-deacetylase PgaB [Zeimonas sediminis]
MFARALSRFAAMLALALLAAAPLTSAARAPGIPPGAFVALSYHEVPEDGPREAAPGAGRYGVEVSALVAQFSWLRENGYRPVSLSEIAEARAGGKPLPPKAVLLSFDDGYADFYHRVYPLLQLFRYPAVIALVGKWMDAPAGTQVDYDGRPMPREAFLSWAQVREMAGSGLVEVASHSYDLHRGVRGNPQGNLQPAATTRIFDPASARYETDEAWLGRVRADLERNSALIERETGKRPRAVVWPYGRYNGALQQVARELGMPMMLTLEGGPNLAGAPLDRIRRIIVEFNPELGAFVDEIEQVWPEDPQRVVHVDLDYVHDPDPEAQERNLSALLDRIQAIRPTTVYLQAFADPDGDGEADALYFPNRHLPMRADLFNRVAWQLETRVGVRVYAWMPMLAFRLPDGHPARDDLVQAVRGEAGSSYRRLSPFSARARATIRDIYEDLGRHAHFAGLLFHDDGLLGDREDASDAALAVYRERWGLPASVDAIRADAGLAGRWADLKTDWLVDFSRELADAAGRFTAPLKTARNLYAAPVLDADAKAWFAQSLPAFLRGYDHVALMAMPYMEGAAEPRRFLSSLVEAVAAQPEGLKRTVFELQARDWRGRREVPAAELAAWIRQLELAGATNVGYYPDDPHAGVPALGALVPAFSVRSLPQP